MPQKPRPLDDSVSMLAWFGVDLRNWRNVRRLSTEALGAKVHLSKTSVERIEKAERPCNAELAAKFDDALEAGGALRRLWRRVEEDADRQRADADTATLTGRPSPSPASEVSIPSSELHVGMAEIELVRAAARDLDTIDQKFGGGGVWRSAQAHLLWLNHVIDRGVYDSRLGRNLHAVAGTLTVSLGWYSYDAGRPAEAWAYFAEGLSAAMLIDDAPLACRTLSVMARQAVDLNKGREAVRFCRQARSQTAIWGATPRVHALLAIREAQGCARVGDAHSCEDALRRAWREWERGPSADDPDWTHFLNEAELISRRSRDELDTYPAAVDDRTGGDVPPSWQPRGGRGAGTHQFTHRLRSRGEEPGGLATAPA